MKEKIERLNKAIEYLRNNGKVHKQQDIADALQMAKGHLSDAVRGGRYFTDGFLKRFAAAYADYISADWLLTGTGAMARIDRSRFRPHISPDQAVVDASPMGTALASVAEDECEPRRLIDAVPDYDFTITVRGDSMLPLIADGDTLACKWLHDASELRSGKIYVVDTRDGAVVKQIERTRDALRCISLNPAYAPFLQPLESILRIAGVRALLRRL